MSKEGPHLTPGRVRSWCITALVAGVALNILFAVIRAYLSLILALAGLVFIARLLWRLTR